jgi:hypothetical protein
MAARRYVPVDYGDGSKVLGIETTVIQAAQALDIAITIAARKEDVEALAGLAGLWISIGEKLLESGQPETQEETIKKTAGFSGQVLGYDDDDPTMIIEGV